MMPPYMMSMKVRYTPNSGCRRVVFLLFLLCLKTTVRRETSKMFRPFVLTTKTTQTRPQVFSVNGSITVSYTHLTLPTNREV